MLMQDFYITSNFVFFGLFRSVLYINSLPVVYDNAKNKNTGQKEIGPSMINSRYCKRYINNNSYITHNITRLTLIVPEKLPVICSKTVVFAGYASYLHHLQMASYDQAGQCQKK